MTIRSTTLLLAALAIASSPAWADCDKTKSDIAAKLDKKGVKNYALDIVATADVKDQKVVGSCEGDTKKIVYKRVAPPEKASD